MKLISGGTVPPNVRKFIFCASAKLPETAWFACEWKLFAAVRLIDSTIGFTIVYSWRNTSRSVLGWRASPHSLKMADAKRYRPATLLFYCRNKSVPMADICPIANIDISRWWQETYRSTAINSPSTASITRHSESIMQIHWRRWKGASMHQVSWRTAPASRSPLKSHDVKKLPVQWLFSLVRETTILTQPLYRVTTITIGLYRRGNSRQPKRETC